MAQRGRVTVAGKTLACHHCGQGDFEVRGFFMYGMGFRGGGRAVMCTACHFVHTFRSKADLVVD